MQRWASKLPSIAKPQILGLIPHCKSASSDRVLVRKKVIRNFLPKYCTILSKDNPKSRFLIFFYFLLIVISASYATFEMRNKYR